MSTKKIEEALELLSGLQGSMGTTAGYKAVGKAVADARKEVGAIVRAASTEAKLDDENIAPAPDHRAARALWRQIAEESK